MMKDQTRAVPPEKIYLQCYNEDEDGELLDLVHDDVTWCVDQINENDAVYILATPELARLLERLAKYVPYTLHPGIDIATQARALAAKIRAML